MLMHHFLILKILLLATIPSLAFANGSSTVSQSTSDYELNASIGIGFEYNDNVDNTASNKITSFINTISPQFTFVREGERLKADFTYRGNYEFYLKNNLDPEYSHYLNTSVSANIVEDLFFLDISENMQQVYEDITLGEFVENENDESTRNRNIFTVSPYFTLYPTSRTMLTLGYSFTDTRYSLDPVNQTPSFLSVDSDQYDFRYNVNQRHNFFARLNHELSNKATLYSGASYTLEKHDDKENTDITRYNFYIGASYQITENLSASLEVGPNYSVPDTGDASLSPYVQASLNYAIGRSVFSFAYNTSFEDDFEAGETVSKSNYSFNFKKQFDRSTLNLGIAYNTYDSAISYRVGEVSEEQGNTISPTVRFDYSLTPRASIFFHYSGQIYEDRNLGDNTHTGYYGVRYELSENSDIGLSHRVRYVNANDTDSYYTNQIMLDFTYSL